MHSTSMSANRQDRLEPAEKRLGAGPGWVCRLRFAVSCSGPWVAMQEIQVAWL